MTSSLDSFPAMQPSRPRLSYPVLWDRLQWARALDAFAFLCLSLAGYWTLQPHRRPFPGTVVGVGALAYVVPTVTCGWRVWLYLSAPRSGLTRFKAIQWAGLFLVLLPMALTAEGVGVPAAGLVAAWLAGGLLAAVGTAIVGAGPRAGEEPMGEVSMGEVANGDGPMAQVSMGEVANGDGPMAEEPTGEDRAGEERVGVGEEPTDREPAAEGLSGDGRPGDGSAGDGWAGEGLAGDGSAGSGRAGEGLPGIAPAGDGRAGDEAARGEENQEDHGRQGLDWAGPGTCSRQSHPEDIHIAVLKAGLRRTGEYIRQFTEADEN